MIRRLHQCLFIVFSLSCQLTSTQDDILSFFDSESTFKAPQKWPYGIIPFQISSSFTKEEQYMIIKALKHIESRSCVRFRPKMWYDWSHIMFTVGKKGCSTNGLGYNTFRRVSYIFLKRPRCLRLKIICHEILHVLGFMHEQNRPDRDKYIQINWENIEYNQKAYKQFARGKFPFEQIPNCKYMLRDKLRPLEQCYNGFETWTYNLPYDYQSIMHYSAYAYSRNEEPTLTPKAPVSIGGDFNGLSNLDFRKLNLLYECY